MINSHKIILFINMSLKICEKCSVIPHDGKVPSIGAPFEPTRTP